MLRRPLVALLIGLFAAIVVGAAGYFLLVGPKKGQVDKKQKEIESTESQIEQQKSTYRQLTDIKNRSAEFEAKLASLEAKIPQQAELPSLIRNIQAAADPRTGVGLPWLSFAPSEVAASSTGAGFSTYDFTMRIAGFYDQVVDLIYRLERMERAIVINSVSMAPSTTILGLGYSPNLGLVACDLDAKTFTFEAPPGQAGQATTPAPQTTPSSSPSSTPSP